MSGYDLIAFDMDGTLLTSKNKVSESSREAIARAVELGKRIAVCTGRAVGEIEPYEENELQNVRYFVCENGALLYDSETKEILSSTVIPDEIVEKIIDIIDGEDCMLIGYSKGRNLVDSIDAERIGISIQSAESINSALYDVMMIFGNEKIKHMLDRMPTAEELLHAINSLKTVK